MVSMKTGSCTLMNGTMDSLVSRPATAQGTSAAITIVAVSRGRPKLRMHMPQIIAAADRQATAASTQSALSRHRKVP
jgi:hypothetical protein